MFFSQYFVKIILWQILLFLWPSGYLPAATFLDLSQPLLAEKTTAGQYGGDSAVWRSAGPRGEIKTLPLAGWRQPGPKRRAEAVDFDRKKLTAKAVYVMDKETGLPLFSFNEDETRAIGSLTKLMTALVFLETNPDWEKLITMEASDSQQGRLYLVEGEQVKIKDIFYTSLIGSSNNATLALARTSGLAPEEFAAKMNAKARTLGFAKTEFVEPTGLSSANQSTAREAALLLKTALSQKTIKEAMAKKNYTFMAAGGQWRRIDSTNLLLFEKWPAGQIAKVAGGKTGYVEEAGFCFIVELENKDGHSVIVAVLGTDSHFARFSEARALADWAFGAYEWEIKTL